MSQQPVYGSKLQEQIAKNGFPEPTGGRAPAGWDQVNWDDPNMHSNKYDAGRMLNGKTKPSEVGAVVSSADFQKRFPGATFNGKDIIDFQGLLSDGSKGTPVRRVDVLSAADPTTDSSTGIWWGDIDNDPTQNGSQPNVPTIGGSAPGVNHTMAPTSAGSSDLMTQILEALQAQTQQPEMNPQDMLLQALR